MPEHVVLPPGTSPVLDPDSLILPQFGATALAGPNPAYFSRRLRDSWEDPQALPTPTSSLLPILNSHKGPSAWYRMSSAQRTFPFG